MADNITREELLRRARDVLPQKYKFVSDEALMRVLSKRYPELEKYEFKPEPIKPKGFKEGVISSAKDQYYRVPEILASTFNAVNEFIAPSEGDLGEANKKLRQAIWQSATERTNKLIEQDPRLREFHQWAQENPFSWGQFVTNPTMFGQVFGQAVTSMGTIMAAGALGGPFGTISAAFIMEGSEAYKNAYDMAKEEGFTEDEIDAIAADAFRQYGAGSAILESIVPLSILRPLGLGRRIANKAFGKFAATHLKNSIQMNKIGVEVGKRSWREFAVDNLGMLDRITSFGRTFGINSIAEATTEGSQYLLEQAIVEGKVKGIEVTADWVATKMQDPEFHASIAGGLVGGGTFATPGALGSMVGRTGQQTAKAVYELGKVFGPEQQETFIDGVLRDNKMSMPDKVRFAKELIKLETGEMVVPEAPTVERPEKAPVTPKKKVVKKPVEPIGEPKPVKPISRPTIKAPTVLERILEPSLGPITEVAGRNLSSKALNYVLREGVQARKEFRKMTPEQRVGIYTMIGQALESVQGVAGKYIVEGKPDQKAIALELRNLRRQGMILETAEQKGLAKTAVKEILRPMKPEELEVAITGVKPEEVVQPEAPVVEDITSPEVEAIFEEVAKTVEKKKQAQIKKQEKKPVGKKGLLGKDLNIDDSSFYSELKIFEPKELVSRAVKVQRSLGYRHGMPRALRRLTTADDITKSISKKSISPENKKLATYLLRREDILKRIRVDWDRTNVYYGMTNNIGIAKDSLMNFEDRFLHEAVHGITARYLRNIEEGEKVSPKETKIYNDLKRLQSVAIARAGGLKKVQDVQKWIEDQSQRTDLTYEDRIVLTEAISRYYGLYTNRVSEFVAEALSSKQFQKLLDGMRLSDKRTVWDRIVGLIHKILGIRTAPNSILTRAIRNIIELIEVAPVTEVKEYENHISDVSYLDDLSNIIELEDYRDGESRKLSHEDFRYHPGAFLEKTLFQEYGVYVENRHIPKLIRIAEKYKDLSFLNDENFEAFEEEFRTKLEQLTGEKLKIASQTKYRNELKSWYQRVLSRIEVPFRDKKDNRFNRTVRNKLQMIVRRARGFYQQPRPSDVEFIQSTNLSTMRNNPKTESQNFIEEDALNGVANKLIMLNLTQDVHEEINTPSGTWYRKAQDIPIGEQFIRDMNHIFHKRFQSGDDRRLMFFFAETSGDNRHLLFSIVPVQYMNSTRADFIAYLDGEMATDKTLKNIEKVHKDNLLKYADRYAKGNPSVYAQLIGYHERWKSIKGRDYLLRELKKGAKGTVAEGFKRLKLDLGEGWVPRGLGSYGLMYVKPDEVEFEATAPDGKTMILKHVKDDGTYGFDGWLMAGEQYMKKINKISGTQGMAYKTIIRDLDFTNPNAKGEYSDYINLKMMEMTPFDGMRVYKKDKVRTLIASYEDGVWKTPEGKVFDKLATTEEVKDAAGYYSKAYQVYNMSERSVRILQVHDRSARMGAHPVNAHELSLDSEWLKSPAAKEYLKTVFEHYKKVGVDYLESLYNFRNNPKALRDFIYASLKEGELPNEIQQLTRLFPNGEGLFIFNYMVQILPTLNQQMISDGLYKLRQYTKGNTTHLLIKPEGPLQLDDKSIAISAENDTIFGIAKDLYKGPKDLDMISKGEAIDIVNEWLEDNEMWVLVHRQPIQGFTKVQPRKVSKFVKGAHGQTVFMSEHDVFRVHEADFDGDTAFIEYIFDTDLINKMKNMVWDKQGKMRPEYSKRNRTIDLEIFKKGPLGGSLSNYNEVISLIDSNRALRAAQGNVVNSLTILHTMAYKGLKFKMKHAPDTTMYAYDPNEKVIMRYWELDPSYVKQVRSRIESEGDNIVSMADKQYLQTTKANEFSLLLQAAVDNDKFGLMYKLPLTGNMSLHNWLLTRMFGRNDMVSDSTVWSGNEIRLLGSLYDLFNYGRDRQGKDRNNSMRRLSQNMTRAKEVYDIYYDNKGTKRNAEAINKELDRHLRLYFEQSSAQSTRNLVNNITSIETNGRITPMEFLLTLPGAYQTRTYIETGETGVNLQGPLALAKEDYYQAHNLAMHAIDNQLAQMLEELPANEREEGWELGQQMGRELHEIFAQRDLQAETRGVDMENPELGGFKYEYGEVQDDFKRFADKWYRKLNKTPGVLRAAMIRFLWGITIGSRKVNKLAKLQPMYLMDYEILKLYGKEYYKNLYKSKTQEITADEGRYPFMTKTITKLKEMGYLCG